MEQDTGDENRDVSAPTAKPRKKKCPRGHRRNKKTGECEAIKKGVFNQGRNTC